MCGFIVLALIDGNVMVFGNQTAYTQTNHPDKDRTHTHTHTIYCITIKLKPKVSCALISRVYNWIKCIFWLWFLPSFNRRATLMHAHLSRDIWFVFVVLCDHATRRSNVKEPAILHTKQPIQYHKSFYGHSQSVLDILRSPFFVALGTEEAKEVRTQVCASENYALVTKLIETKYDYCFFFLLSLCIHEIEVNPHSTCVSSHSKYTMRIQFDVFFFVRLGSMCFCNRDVNENAIKLLIIRHQIDFPFKSSMRALVVWINCFNRIHFIQVELHVSSSLFLSLSLCFPRDVKECF